MIEISCKYHPLQSACWFCPNCQVSFCVNCVTDPNGDIFPSCTLCRKTLSSVSISKQLPHVGSQLNRFLVMALNWKNLLFFLLSALLIVSLPYHWISILGCLIVAVPVVGVLFQSMEQSANDERLTIDFNAIFSPLNRDMFSKFTFYLILVGTLITKSQASGSALFENILFVLLVFSLPASLMILMMEKRFFSSINPLKILEVMRIVQLDYLLVFGFSYVILQLGGLSFSVVESGSAVGFGKSLTYLFLSFFLTHILFMVMGFLIFQKHVEFNYSVRSINLANIKSEEVSAMVEADIYVQEGRFEDAEKILLKYVSDTDIENNYVAYEKLILLYAFQEKKSCCNRICEQYFQVLVDKQKTNKAADFYSELFNRSIEFIPEQAKLALAIASVMKNKAHSMAALKLLSHYNSKPTLDISWDEVALCRAKLLLEFTNETRVAAELLDSILRRSLKQELLDEAYKYKELFRADIERKSISTDDKY